MTGITRCEPVCSRFIKFGQQTNLVVLGVVAFLSDLVAWVAEVVLFLVTFLAAPAALEIYAYFLAAVLLFFFVFAACRF